MRFFRNSPTQVGDVWCWGRRDPFGNGCRGSWELVLAWLWARESQLWSLGAGVQKGDLGDPKSGLREPGESQGGRAWVSE